MELITPEKALYPIVLNWIKSRFKDHEANTLRGPFSQVFATDISAKASEQGSGLWTRPDLAALVLNKGQFVPSWSWSLVSFEIKTATNVDEQSVYETIGHTRFANSSFLVWQASENLSTDDQNIVELCRQYQIGAITSEDPRDATSFRLRNMGAYASIPSYNIDGFIEARFPDHERDRIKNWLKENDWTS